MQTIVLIMRRRPIAQAFSGKLEDNPDVVIIQQSDYSRADRAILEENADVALIEVGETSDYDAPHCLALCERLRKHTPRCKLVLMCPEQDKSSVNEMVRAKKGGRIDDFVFHDASLDYLVSKLLSML